MKNYIFLILFILGSIGVIAETANAQEKPLNTSRGNFQLFFRKFIRTIKKNDRTSVAALTKFPFRYGFDTGDEGLMSRNQFIKRFNDIFGKSPKLFFIGMPRIFTVDKGAYIVSGDDGSHMIFVRSRTGFRFTAYIVEP